MNQAAAAGAVQDQGDLRGSDGLTGDAQGVDLLTACAIGYLAFPNLIFLFGWFRPPFALPLCAVIAYLVCRALGKRPCQRCPARSRVAFVVLVASSCAWAAFGGGSHFMYANPDWEVRDAVLGDLVRLDWPVHYASADGGPLLLRSAIGFFLPAALFGKAFGLGHIDLVLYVWTAIGVLIMLLLLPLPREAGWRLALAVLVVVFFSGMDFVGAIVATGEPPIFPLRIEWWLPLSYPSLTGQLLWAPNHCLPIWIATLLGFRHRHGAEFLRVTAASLPLTLIWTPFAVIGCAPFIVLGTIRAIRRYSWRVVPWDSVVAAIAFSVPTGLFLIFDIGRIDSSMAAAAAQPAVKYVHQAVSLPSYLLFAGCEFFFLAMVIAPHVQRAKTDLALAVILLLTLPLFRFGPTNDLGLRASAPSLLILLAVCLHTLFARDRSPFAGTLWIAWLFLAIGAHTAFNELWRAVVFPRWQPDYQRSLADWQGGQPSAHYAGRRDAFPLADWLRSSPDARGRPD